MPKDTFYNLDNEKRSRVLNAANLFATTNGQIP